MSHVRKVKLFCSLSTLLSLFGPGASVLTLLPPDGKATQRGDRQTSIASYWSRGTGVVVPYHKSSSR
jgi:hypothetical protein